MCVRKGGKGSALTLKLGISSCLLGERVRWNGDHKLDRFLLDTLGKFVEYVAVCPEVECGFSVPREPFRLVGDPKAPRLVTSTTKNDHTERMLDWSRKRVREGRPLRLHIQEQVAQQWYGTGESL